MLIKKVRRAQSGNQIARNGLNMAKSGSSFKRNVPLR